MDFEPLAGSEYRRMREDAGLTQDEVATLTATSRTTVTEVERSRRPPSYSYQRRFLAALKDRGSLTDAERKITVAQARSGLLDAKPRLAACIEQLQMQDEYLKRAKRLLDKVSVYIDRIDEKERGILSSGFDPTECTDGQLEAVLNQIESSVLEMCLEYNLQLIDRDGFRQWIMGMASSVDTKLRK